MESVPTDSMPSGVKKKTEKRGKNKGNSMTMGDAELAVRFLQEGDSSDDNTDEQLRVSYKECKLRFWIFHYFISFCSVNLNLCVSQ